MGSSVELNRLEYKNTHKYQRHTVRFSDKDEDELTPKQQERRIDKDIPFNVLADERRDREILFANLPQQDRDILKIMSSGKTQKEAAEELGITQGYISTQLKHANCSVDDYVFNTGTREEIVWHRWNRFVNDGETILTTTKWTTRLPYILKRQARKPGSTMKIITETNRLL